MSRATSPLVKAALIAAVMLVCAARVRAVDPKCTQEINRCLAACRAVCSRRIVENDRASRQIPQQLAQASIRLGHN